MASQNQLKAVQAIAIKCIPLPDCPVKQRHAVAARVMMEREVIKIIDDAVGSIPRMAGNACGQDKILH